MLHVCIFISVFEDDPEESRMYASGILVPDDKRNKDYIQDQGYQAIDSAIRTLRKLGKISPASETETAHLSE